MLVFDVDDLIVSQKDVATKGHSVGELVMDHRPLVSQGKPSHGR